jgi:peroxiredoxin
MMSRDAPWTLVAWAQVVEPDFPLLSDFNGDATRALDIAHSYRGMRDVSRRSAFLIEEGTIRGAWLYDAGEVPDVDVLLEAARAL